MAVNDPFDQKLGIYRGMDRPGRGGGSTVKAALPTRADFSQAGGSATTMSNAAGLRARANDLAETARQTAARPAVAGSLASSMDGDTPTYDNNSIERMMARNAGQGGWANGRGRMARDIGRRGREAGGGIAATEGAMGGQPQQQPNYQASNLSVGVPRRVSGNLRGADDERKQRIRDVNDAVWSLTKQGGGLNMRSKRELFGQLLRQKNDLTGQAFDAQHRRDLAGAGMENDAAQTQARLAAESTNRGLDRRQRADEFNTTREDSRAAAEAKAPMEYLEMLEKLTNIRATDAEARREDDVHGIGRDDLLDNRAQEFAASYREANPNATQQEVEAALSANEMEGTSPLSPTTRASIRRRTVEGGLSLNEGTNWFNDVQRGVVRLPFTQRDIPLEQVGDLNPQSFQYAPTGGLAGIGQRFFGAPKTFEKVYGDPNDDRAPRTVIPAEQAQAEILERAALARRSRREGSN